MGNSANFQTITHMTLSAKQFRKYGILMIDVLLYSVSGQNNGETDPQFPDSDWSKLWKS
jgi:hypothetical protein